MTATLSPGTLALPLSPAGRVEATARLRQTLRALERPSLAGEAVSPIPFGIPEIDAFIGGGLACGALHEIAAVRESELSAATCFALGLAASRRDGLVWVAEDISRAESGLPYGPGLDEAGLAPERLIAVTVPHKSDVLWSMEEALRCAAIGTVIGELRSDARGIDPVATRRLSLAAAERGVLAFILRSAPGDEPSAAATRWLIGAAPSHCSPTGGVGPPRLRAQLVRNRRGQSGTWILEWHRVEQRFVIAPDSQPVAATAADRPHRTARVA